jgi:uncharacterized protein YjgD (DUF1641 family)
MNALVEERDKSVESHAELSEIGRKVDLICEEIERQRQYRLALEDLGADLTRVAKEAFPDAVTRMEEFERNGYFRFAKQMGGIANALVASHSASDLDQARASIPHLIGLLRELTRPEVLQALEAIVYGFGEVQAVEKKDVSVLTLMREANSQDARRGFDILVRFLKVVGARSAKESRRDR